MPRKLSSIAPDWWDYTTLEDDLISDAAALTPSDIQQLSRPGFRVVMYDTLEDFYLAEALEYIHAWREATADNPVGICGPIGPTEQLPLMPAEACPLYSLQGATCDPGLIAHFAMPKRADDDIKWLIVYVLLSRVRSLANLRSVGITSQIRKIIEGGPPSTLAANFERLFRAKITNTKAAAVAAKAALGWQ